MLVVFWPKLSPPSDSLFLPPLTKPFSPLSILSLCTVPPRSVQLCPSTILGANERERKMLQNEAYINQIWREFLKYGNPGSYFWDKNKLFSQISGNWLKIWPKMIFVVSFNILYMRTLISKYKRVKNSKKYYWLKLTKINPLIHTWNQFHHKTV